MGTATRSSLRPHRKGRRIRPAVAAVPSPPATGSRVEATERGFGVLVAVAAGVALVAAGATLGREPVWRDELASFALVGRSFGAMVRQFPHEHSGTLFDLALWSIVRMGRTSADWLRMPALVAVALAVAVCGLVGRRLAGSRAGVLAAFLLAVNPFAVRYAQEGRMYGFALLFSLVAVWTLLRAIDRPTGLRWSLYALAVVAMGYSHDFALLTVAAHPVLVRSAEPSVRRRFATALGAAAILLVPLAMLAVSDWSTNPLNWVTRPGPRAAGEAARVMTGSRAGILVCLAVLAAAATLLRRHAKRGERVAFLLAWLVVPFALLFVVSQAKPLLVTRYLLPSLPALCLLLAIAVGVLGRRLAIIAALTVAAVFLLATVRSDRAKTNADYPAIVTYLHAHNRSNEPVVIAAADTLQTANGLLFYGLEPGFDRSRLLWMNSDLQRLPDTLTLLDLTASSRRTTADIRNLLRGRAGLWIVLGGVLGGAVPPKQLTPFTRWPGSEATGWERFRGVEVIHLQSPSAHSTVTVVHVPAAKP